LEESAEDLAKLCEDIRNSFINLLYCDWNTAAGRRFNDDLNSRLLGNITRQGLLLSEMSKHLKLAYARYQEVFIAADAVADAEY